MSVLPGRSGGPSGGFAVPSVVPLRTLSEPPMATTMVAGNAFAMRLRWLLGRARTGVAVVCALAIMTTSFVVVAVAVAPSASASPPASGHLAVVAGTGSAGEPSAGAATSSPFERPQNIAMDSSGNLYIADPGAEVVLKVNTSGQLSVFAGIAGQTGSAAQGTATSVYLSAPSGVAVDSSGNVYIADTGHARVDKVTSSGTLSYLAGTGTAGQPTAGTATSSELNNPSGVAVDSSGNVYIADRGNSRVEKVTSSGTLSIIAGTGTAGAPTAGVATNSKLNGPFGIAVDSSGNVYIGDLGNDEVEKVTSSGTLSIFAGTGTAGSATAGPATSSELNQPYGLAVDSSGDVYIADYAAHEVDRVTPSGTLAIFAGTGTAGTQTASTTGVATSTNLGGPNGVALDSSGDVYISDYDDRVIDEVGAWTAPTFAAESPGAATYDSSYSYTFTASGYPAPTFSVTSGALPYGLSLNATTGVVSGTPLGSGTFSVTATNAEGSATAGPFSLSVSASPGDVQVVAGTGIQGEPTAGVATSSELEDPQLMTMDSSGDLYVADPPADVIEKITPSGTLSIFAGIVGSAGAPTAGPATSSKLSQPTGVAVDSSGDVYINDPGNRVVEKVTPSGTLSVFAGIVGSSAAPTAGPATSSGLGVPAGIALDSSGNLYITDISHGDVEKVTPGGTLSIIAGTGSTGTPTAGPATSSHLGGPFGIATDSSGDVYIADANGNRVEKVTPGGTLSIIAGTGTAGAPTAGVAANSKLNSPYAVAVDAAGNLYIGDYNNHEVEKVTPGGTLSIFAGTGTSGTPTAGPATSANMGAPDGLTFDSSGDLYVDDYVDHLVYEVVSAAPTFTADTPPSATYDSAYSYTFTATGNPAPTFSVSSGALPYGLSLNTTTGVVSGTPMGSGTFSISASNSAGTATAGPFTLSVTAPAGDILAFAGTGASGSPTAGVATSSALTNPQHVALDSSGDVYIADTNNNEVEKVTPSGTLSVFAGTGTAGAPTAGPATSSDLDVPRGVAVDSSGNVYIADAGNDDVEKVTPSGTLSVFAGTGTAGVPTAGPATSSELDVPRGVAVDSSGNVYIADSLNNEVEKVTPSGTLSVFAGTGTAGVPTAGAATSSRLDDPAGLAFDGSGNLYIADIFNHEVEKVTPSGTLSVFAGTGTAGTPTPGVATSAALSQPYAVAASSSGNVYIADYADHEVDEVQPTGLLSVFAGTGTSGTPTAGLATSSKLGGPTGLAVDSSGDVFIGDFDNHMVDEVTAETVPAFIADSPGSATIGSSYSYTFVASGIPSPTFAVASGSLPAGLSLNTSTGVLSGTPTTAGVSTFTISATNGGGSVSTGSLSITTGSAPTFTAQGPPSATTGVAYSYTFAASGYPSPTFAVASGSLPAGLSLNTSTGVLSGTPTGSGTFTVSATNSFGTATTSSITINVLTPDQLLVYAGVVGHSGAPTAGPANSSYLLDPDGIAFDSSGDVYIADTGESEILKVNPAGTLSVFAGTGTSGAPTPGPATASDLHGPEGVTVDGAGNVYIADTGNSEIEKVDTSGVLSVVAGNGTAGTPTAGAATNSHLDQPRGVVLDSSGNLYIADTANDAVEKVNTSGVLSVIAGVPGTSGAPTAGPASSSHLSNLCGIAIDSSGNLYIGDNGNDVVEKITASGTLSVVAGIVGSAGTPTPGRATSSHLDNPRGVAVDAAGEVFVVDNGNHEVEKISPSGTLAVIAGTGSPGAPTAGIATSSDLYNPQGIGVDSAGNVYIGDTLNNVVEKISGTLPLTSPAFTSDSPASDVTVSTSYTYTFAAIGNPAPTFSVASGSLPTGLSLNTSSGVLSGTPTASGAYTFSVSATNTSGSVSSGSISMTVGSVPVFTAVSPAPTGVTGTAYSYTFVASGYPAATFAVASGSLPAGLSLNTSSGVLSGTPTTTGPSTFTVSASNVFGSVTSGSLTVTIESVPVFTADTPASSISDGAPYSYTFVATGSPAPTFSLALGSLPTGLSLNPSTGVLSGTPGASGSFTFVVGATNAAGGASSGSITMAVDAGPVFTADTPPSTATISMPFNFTFAASGFPTPTFAVASGSLPTGLTLNTSSGVLSGTPTASGVYTFTVSATNSSGSVTSGSISMTVGSVPAFTAVSPASTGVVGSAYSYTFSASGYPAASFSVTSGSLPAGLSLNTSSGVLSGTPTTTGVSTFTVSAANVFGSVTSASISITVQSVPAFTADSPASSVSEGVSYSYTFTASGSPAPTFSVSAGSLPTGLSLNSSTGVLSGTPSATGSFTFTVGATNAAGGASSGSITMAVDAGPVFTADTPPSTATISMPFTFTFAASGYPAPTFGVASGSLPTGLSLTGSTGVLSGTPSATGVYTFSVSATNSSGSVTSGSISMTVGSVPAFTADSPTSAGVVSSAYSYTFSASGYPAASFSVASGSLPAGLSLNSSTGALSGTPTTTGPATFTVSASNVFGSVTSGSLTVTVGSVPVFTADTPASTGVVGAGYSYTFNASGSPAPTFSVGSGSLPTGLSLNSSTGVLAGTPTTPGLFSFTVTASSVSGSVTTASIAITIQSVPVFTADNPAASISDGATYSYTFVASGSPAPTFAVTSGSLPTGLSLNSSTGVLAGTPSATGSFTFTVTASNVVGSATSGSIGMDVTAAPVFVADFPPPAVAQGSSYSYTFVASGSPAPTFAVSAGSLPPGLSLDPTTGILSGTPTTTWISTFEVTASNVHGSATTAAIVLTVGTAPILTDDSPNTSAVVGSSYSYTFAASGYPAPVFSVSSGSLPVGLTLDAGTGVLSGTPSVAGNSTFTITAGNLLGSAVSQPVTIDVSAPALPAAPTTPTPSTASVAQSASAGSAASAADGSGYWSLSASGTVSSFGDAPDLGSTADTHLDAPIDALRATNNGKGYWLVGADGGVFAFGDAGFYGSMAGVRLNAPVVGITSTPDGGGYWLVSSDGGVFAFGDAGFYGSMAGVRLNAPVVGITSTPDGGGYWLVSSDGGVFAFGDAGFYGSMAKVRLNGPVEGITSTTDGRGYWLFAADGGVFAFGDAAFYGSLGATGTVRITGMIANADTGYQLVTPKGLAYRFGVTT
jgi:sugar lactone lactonase YvrE